MTILMLTAQEPVELEFLNRYNVLVANKTTCSSEGQAWLQLE